MLTKFRLLIAALVLALGLGGAVAVASPAQAAYSDCPLNYFCLWTNTDATGGRYQYSRSSFTNAYHNGIRLGSGISNRSYSWYNRLGSGWAVILFDASNCDTASWHREMQNNQYATAQGSDWGGRVSSIQLWNASPLKC